MKNKMDGACKPAVLGVFLSGLTCPVFAASDLSLSLGVGLEAHDNAALVNSDERSDTKRLVSGDLGYKKTDGSVTVDMTYGASYGDYQHDVESDETAINGQTALKWQIKPRQLEAVFYHQIAHELTDRRLQDVSSNREERSIITTGLDGYLHLSGVDSLVLSPRFTDVRFQDSDNSNSQRAGMTAALEHKISPLSALGLNVTYNHVTFDESENDYDSPEVMLSFRTALARLSYEIGLGASRINRDTGDDVDGSIVRAAIDYHGDEGRDWGASYVRQLTDSSIGLSGSELTLTNFRSNDSNFDQVDIIEEDKIDAYWRDRINVSNLLTFGAGYQKQDYQDTPRDQNIAYAQLGYQYTINSRWSVGADGSFERTKFLDEPKTEYDTTRVYLNATYHPSRPLEIRLSVGQDKRDAETSAQSYTDNVAILGVRYRFF